MTRLLTIASVCLVCGAGPALAQSPDRGYVQAVGGSTFGTEPSGIVGAGAGLSIGRRVQIVGEGGRMGDVLPHSVRRDLDALVREIGDDLGVRLTADVKVPATYWASGVRYRLAESGRTRPYVTAMSGVARLSADVAVVGEGVRVTLDDAGKEEAGLQPETNALVALGGGVELLVTGRIGIDLGYQYNRIFTKDPAINTHRALAGVTVRF